MNHLAENRQAACERVPRTPCVIPSRSQLGEVTDHAKDLHASEQARRDAALSLDWSNGQTEEQINRLKTIKRRMYGHARLDLLERNLLAA